jgi:hypothetical protein
LCIPVKVHKHSQISMTDSYEKCRKKEQQGYKHCQ